MVVIEEEYIAPHLVLDGLPRQMNSMPPNDWFCNTHTDSEKMLRGKLLLVHVILELLKLYALFPFPFLSLVNVAPFTVPLFPFPLSSFAFPLKGHHPTKPLVGT
jgi:hypothetical protein